MNPYQVFGQRTNIWILPHCLELTTSNSCGARHRRTCFLAQCELNLRIYLKRTKEARGKRHRLLLPVDPNNTKVRDITANTVSSWVKNTILQAYSRSGSPLHDEYLRRLYGVDAQEDVDFHRAAHEVRAQSASYKFLSTNQSLEAILRACYWRSSTVFTHFYLRDITVEDREHLYRLSTCAPPGCQDSRNPNPLT